MARLPGWAPQLMTPLEAARALRVHPDTLRHWAMEGKIPNQKTPGGHRRYDAAIINAIAAGTWRRP